MMSAGAEVLCRIAGQLADVHGVRRRSQVAEFSRGIGRLSLILMAREVRATGAAAKRAAR